MLRNAAAKKKLCPARPQRSNCSLSFRALTIYTPRLSRLKEYPRSLQLARLRPRQQAQPPVQPNARHVFSARILSFSNLHKTLPLPAPVWPLKDLLRRPFHKTLPLPVRVWPLNSLLCRTALRVLFLGRLQHCPFKRFRHSLRDFYQNIHTFSDSLFLLGPYSPFQIQCSGSVLFSVSL